MTAFARFLDRLHQWAASLPLLARIAIGNSLIIAAGAIGGTLLTHAITERGAELIFILFFALAGLLASIALNLYIVRAALKPLQELRRMADEIGLEQADREQVWLHNPDPDTSQLAARLTSLISQLETSNQQLRAISAQAINAQEDERKRIARSLHDDTGQALLTLILNLERLEARMSDGDAETKARLVETRALAASTLEDLRKVIHGLRPAILDDLGLAPAIRWYARSNLESAGVQVAFDAPQEPLDLPPELKTALFRIAQEAVNNIVRHAQAKTAKITLDRDQREVYLCIQDDGRGFTVAGDLGADVGEAIRLHQWGLVGIQERVELVGGTLNVISEPGKGSLLEVYVPLPETGARSRPQDRV